MKKVFFLFPVHNEEKRIKNVLFFQKWLSENISSCEVKLIFLLNNCTDKTESMIVDLFEQSTYQIIKSRLKSRGSGISIALNRLKTDYFAIASVDNAWDFSFYKNSIDLILANKKIDVIYGPKTHKESIIKKTFIRKLVSFFSLIFTRTLYFPYIKQDTQCIKIFKSNLPYLKKISNYNYFSETEFYLLSIIYKSNIRNIKVDVSTDNKGSKVNLLGVLSFIFEAIHFRILMFIKHRL